MCGGSRPVLRASLAVGGLSPRVRGKPQTGATKIAQTRSIPACAGEATPQEHTTREVEVYPRVCGGSSAPSSSAPASRGLSPRVRGKRTDDHHSFLWPGSIPACAGEALSAAFSRPWAWVYPRVCGGSPSCIAARIAVNGLSPRVRGKRRHHQPHPAGIRSILACAGEAFQPGNPGLFFRVYPRVCGGSAPGAGAGATCVRSIPACAGEAEHRRPSSRRTAVYPRVCGGSVAVIPLASKSLGLSPRVRGKR